jgi:hypothetical protein
MGLSKSSGFFQLSVFFCCRFLCFSVGLAGETAPRPFFALTLHGGLFFEEVRPDQCDRTEHPGRQTVIWNRQTFVAGVRVSCCIDRAAPPRTPLGRREGQRRYSGRAGPYRGRHYRSDQRGARLPRRSLAFRSNLVFGTTLSGSETMMQSCASAAKLRRAGPFYKRGTKAMGGSGTPPPRIVIGSVSPKRTRAEWGLSLGCLDHLYLLLQLKRRLEPDEASCPPAPCRW